MLYPDSLEQAYGIKRLEDPTPKELRDLDPDYKEPARHSPRAKRYVRGFLLVWLGLCAAMLLMARFA